MYAGKIKIGDSLFNTRTKKKERIQDLLKVYADKFERIQETYAGDIITLSGLKDIKTGDTLCNESFQVALESLDFPDPVIYMSIEPKNTTDREKLNSIIQYLLLEDPTITFNEDSQTGQTLIGGMGELHIQILLDRIKKTYGIDLKSGNPQVAYRESPIKAGNHTYSFDKKIEGNVQHAVVTLSVEPAERTK